MSKLLELAREAGDITVAVSLADLIECNEDLIARTRRELEQFITDAGAETYPSVSKVAEMLDVDKSTLWQRNFASPLSNDTGSPPQGASGVFCRNIVGG